MNLPRRVGLHGALHLLIWHDHEQRHYFDFTQSRRSERLLASGGAGGGEAWSPAASPGGGLPELAASAAHPFKDDEYEEHGKKGA